MGDGWRFRLLGSLEIRYEDASVPIAAGKQRILVAVLALAEGQPVTVERLVACLWGEQPPTTARNTLQNYILRIRRTLRVSGQPSPLVTLTAGYRLDLPTDAVDVHRFRELLRSARSDAVADEPASAVALVDEALALWHGEPLTDVPSELLHREVVPGLVELRLTALEQRIDLDLRLGRHQDLITELVALTTENPLRERMWAQLMLALYRNGRPAEALDAYRQAGKILAEELGIDPGPELHQLHQAVLTNDPDLAITDHPRQRTGRSVAAPVVPRQLPAPNGHFVGRASELRELDARLTTTDDSAPLVISAIGGTAGIGKTALALHWGHRNAEKFPDGQLYVNLRGFDSTGAPVPAMAALRSFLIALGVSAEEVPGDPDEQVALYRSRLAGRRMLVVLDNARDAEQVRPLLPGAPGCLVLVTSRDQLAGLVALDGAVPVTLCLLTHDEAHDLLIRRLGRDRVDREQPMVEELISLCARLPLALNIAAAHAALHPNRPLAGFVGELRDSRRRLDALSTGEATADVRVVFSWSYRTLTPATARVFRLLGLHPGPDIGLYAAAGLAGLDLGPTRTALDQLTRAHLIAEHSPGRYTMHDLLRAYATERALDADSDTDPAAALRRVLDFYVQTAWSGERLLDPLRQIHIDPPAPGVHPQPLPDVSAALAWFDLEHANLLSAQRAAAANGSHLTVWCLARALNTFQSRQGRGHDLVAVWRLALDASTRLPDPTAGMFAHQRLGSAFAHLGRHEEGIGQLLEALALAEEHDAIEEQAHTNRALAWAWELKGDDGQALLHATRALDLFRALGQPAWEAKQLNQVGWYAARLGDYDTARVHCEAALALHRHHDDRHGEALTLDSLGYITHHSGQHQQAIAYYQQALALFRALGHTSAAAITLDELGHLHVAVGELDQARAVWREAQELYWQQERDADAYQVRQRLEALDRPGDDS